MTTNLTIILLLCSIGVFGQAKKLVPKPYTTFDGKHGLEYSKSDTSRYWNNGWFNGYVTIQDYTKSDTTAVYMLVSDKADSGSKANIIQMEGYSIKSMTGFTPYSNYLLKDKTKMPDNYIVWMSTER